MTTNAIAVLNRFNDLFRLRLPKATGALFAAKTRSGRYVKTFLFGVGVVLPLGSLIWVLLCLHGARVGVHALPRLVGSDTVVDQG